MWWNCEICKLVGVKHSVSETNSCMKITALNSNATFPVA